MLQSTGILKQSKRTLTQPAPDGLILLHLDSGEYFALDEVSARVWELLDGTRDISAIVQAICVEYDAPAARVEADVTELLDDLLEADLVVRAA